MKKLFTALATVAAASALWIAPGKAKKPRPISADSVAVLAEIDSFPVIVVRDSAGGTIDTEVTVGDSLQLCAMGRNRYTNETRLFISKEAPLYADSVIAHRCETARLLYESQRAL